MTLRTAALKGFSWTILDKLISRLGEFLITVYLARALGPDSFGLIGTLAAFVAVAQVFSDSGFLQALVQRNKHANEHDFSTVFAINITLGVVLYAVLFLSSNLIADFFGNPNLVDASRWLFIVIVLNAIGIVSKAKLTIAMDFRSIAMASALATFSGGVVGLYSAHAGFGYWALIFMAITKSGANTFVLMCLSKWIPRVEISTHSARQLFRFGGRILLSGLINTGLNNLYVIFTGKFYSTLEVGYLTQSTKMADSASGVVAGVIRVVSFPILSSVNDERARIAGIFQQLLEMTVLTTLPIMVGFCAISSPFIALVLGDQWMPIIPAFAILCIARVIMQINMLNTSVLNALGRPDLSLRIDFLKIPATLLIVGLSMPFGIEGVALGLLLTNAFCFFLSSYYPGKLLGLGALAQLQCAAKPIFSVVAMWFVISQISHGVPLVEILLKTIVGSFVYFTMLMIMRVEIILKLVKLYLFSGRQ